MTPNPISPVLLTTNLDRVLSDPDIPKRIFAARAEILTLLDLVQRDAVTEANRATAGELVYAIKLVRETVEIVAAKGGDAKAREEKSK